mgnify:CR=1 FL=1|jgi:hypothetical protein
MARRQSLRPDHEEEVRNRMREQKVADGIRRGRGYVEDHPLSPADQWIKDFQDLVFGRKIEFPKPPTPPALDMPKPIQPVRRRRNQESFNTSDEQLKDTTRRRRKK